MSRNLPLAAVAALGLGLLASLTPSTAMAGPIERACLKSDRNAASRAICACIQDVADVTLGGSDQKRAAKFFTDPDKANDTWLSKSARDDAFWDRYKAFGAAAENSCSGA